MEKIHQTELAISGTLTIPGVFFGKKRSATEKIDFQQLGYFRNEDIPERSRIQHVIFVIPIPNDLHLEMVPSVGVQLLIFWPIFLERRVPINLIVDGFLQTAIGEKEAPEGKIFVKVYRYQFRTAIRPLVVAQ